MQTRSRIKPYHGVKAPISASHRPPLAAYCIERNLMAVPAAGRPLYETFSSAVVNTAATLAAATFVGVFDLFFTLQQMRHNRESERRWEELVAQMRQDFQAQQERQEAQQEVHQQQIAAQQEAYQAQQEAYQARQDENQQQLAALLAQNQQINARLLDFLERRNGPAAGASD